MNILLVDDESEILEILVDMYERHFDNLAITTASNGALALHECWEKKFDLICTDYRKPVLNEMEFTDLLRHKEGLNLNTAIIFLSGFIPEFKYKTDIYDLVYLVEKPVQTDRLMRTASIATKFRLNNKVG